MAKRFGIDIRVWAGMTTYERMQAKKQWMIKQGKEAERRKLQRLENIRKRRRWRRKETDDKTKPSETVGPSTPTPTDTQPSEQPTEKFAGPPEPKYTPKKSDFPMPGDPDFGKPPTPTHTKKWTTSIQTIESPKKIFSVEEYQQYLMGQRENILQMEQELRGVKFNLTQQYIVDGLPMPGFIAQAYYRRKATEVGEIGGFYLTEAGKSTEWHPHTYIVKSDKGFKTVFPYAGAEKYTFYKKRLDESGDVGWVMTSLTPEDPFGLVSGGEWLFGSKQKAYDVKIQAMHRVSGLKSPTDFALWWLESPVTQVGFAVTASYGIGKIGTYLAGRASQSITLTKALQHGGQAVAGAFIGSSLVSADISFKKGEVGEGIRTLGMTGIFFAAGYAGYRMGARSYSGLFGKGKGTTAYELGAYKAHKIHMRNLMKSREIDVLSGARSIKASGELMKLKADIRLRGLSPFQPEIDFSTVQSLRETPGLRRWFSRHGLFRRAEIFGGASSAKPSTHDIDIMYRSPLGGVETQYASTRMGYGKIGQYADIKPWQSPGTIVGRFGAVKMPSYQYPSGLRGGRWPEQFFRLGESSLELAHIGRLRKDIPGALYMLDKIYAGAGGVPPAMQPVVEQYTFSMRGLYETPVMMSAESSSYWFGPSLKQQWWDFKTQTYQKITPKLWKQHMFSKVMSGSSVTIPTSLMGGYLPPSPSVVPSSSWFSTSVIGLSFTPSKSVSPSISSGFTPSFSISKPTHRRSYIPTSPVSKAVSAVSTTSTFPTGGRYTPPSFSTSIGKTFQPPSFFIKYDYTPPSPSSIRSVYPVSITTQYPSTSEVMKHSKVPPGFLPKIYGRGPQSLDELYNLGYRFREFKIPNLEKIIKKVKL